jgi:hypothetical protein
VLMPRHYPGAGTMNIRGHAGESARTWR